LTAKLVPTISPASSDRIVNPLDPAMLSVQTANVLAWDLESPLKSRNREQGTRNGQQEKHFM